MKNIAKNSKFPQQTTQFFSTNSNSKKEEADSSSSEFEKNSAMARFCGERGFPTKCVCGSVISIYTSQSKNNPGRPYFRCARSREDGHLFKWVEDGMYEEVKDILVRFERREFEIDNGILEVNDLKVEVQNLKQEIIGCKTELRKSKTKMIMIIVCFGVLALVIGYHLIFNDVGKSLAFGNL